MLGKAEGGNDGERRGHEGGPALAEWGKARLTGRHTACQPGITQTLLTHTSFRHNTQQRKSFRE